MSEHGHPGSAAPLSFALFDGGPFYRLQVRLGLVRARRRPHGLAVLYAVLFTWVPMAILAAAQGLALGPTRLESFLMDFAVNARFLVAVPVFLVAETLCGKQLLSIVQQFLKGGLVKDTSRARFEVNVRDTVRLSHSGRTEAVLIGLAYLQSAIHFVLVLDLPEATWRLPVRDGHHVLSLAGGWEFLVAFPLCSFLFWRWLWRLGLWWRLLWQSSRLDLHLTPAHRDGAGGLGFLSESLPAFAGFAFGVTVLAAGWVADFVVYEGQSPLQYEWEVAGFVAFLLLLIAGPMLAFVLPLYEAKEQAILGYGAFASRQIQQVERKWLSKENPEEDAGIDFRAVAHVGSSVTAVREMSLIPLYKDDVLKLVIVTLLPFVPLVAALIPMDEVLALLLKVLR